MLYEKIYLGKRIFNIEGFYTSVHVDIAVRVIVPVPTDTVS